MGLIIRTAGLSADHDDIEWDYKALMQQWQMIDAAHKSQAAPCLIHEDENIVTRMIRIICQVPSRRFRAMIRQHLMK